MGMFRKVPDITSFIIVLSVTIIPVLLLFPSFSPYLLTNSNLLFVTLGQIFAVSGASLFALNFILTTRIKFLENFFKGLNRVYLYHHNTGAIGFIFLLLHPLFLSLPSLFNSVQSFVSFFLPPLSQWPQIAGEIAIWIIIVLLILTFFVKLPYEFWKKTHQYLGLALPFAFLHIAFIPGVMSTLPLLKIYMLSLFGVATLSFAYKTLFGKIFMRKYQYEVKSVSKKGNEIIEVILLPLEKKLMYSAGQFMYVTIPHIKNIKKEEHPFSITSDPKSEQVSFSVKALGDFTGSLKNLKNKNKIALEGPYGRFIFDIPNKKQIWIAGGIGIAPFLSIARSLTKETKYDVTLYYTVSTREEAAYLSELLTIQKQIPNFKVVPHFSKERKRLSAEVVRNEIKDFNEREIFLCGPIPMMQSLRSQFKALGIKNYRIHSEEFQLI